jgi:hypothetical protein
MNVVLGPMEPEDKDPKPTSPKRKHDESEEGSWTLVTTKRKKQAVAGQRKDGKLRRTRRGKPGSKQNGHSHGHSHGPNLNDTAEEVSIDSPEGKFAIARSNNRIIKGVSTLLSSLKLNNGALGRRILAKRNGRPLDVQDAVIIGLGNLDDSADRNPQRAALQTGLFLAIINALMGHEVSTKELEDLKLKANNPKARKPVVSDSQELIPDFVKSPIPTVSQDPAFTAIDSAVLSSFNIATVDHPKGVDSILEHTFVYAPFVDVTVLMPLILQNKNPAVYVGVDFDEILDVINEPEDYAER